MTQPAPKVLRNFEVLYLNLSPSGFMSTVVRDLDDGKTYEIAGGYATVVADEQHDPGEEAHDGPTA